MRSGEDPELADASGFWGLHEHDLRTPHHFVVINLHVPIDELLLTKVLQTLWFDEGEPAACGAVTDGAFVGAARLTRAQTQLVSGEEDDRETDGSGI